MHHLFGALALTLELDLSQSTPCELGNPLHSTVEFMLHHVTVKESVHITDIACLLNCGIWIGRNSLRWGQFGRLKENAQPAGCIGIDRLDITAFPPLLPAKLAWSLGSSTTQLLGPF
jgi:hypothetical protein